MSSSISLISAEPNAFAFSAAARARAAVAGKRSRFASGGSSWSHQPPFTVKIGAAGKTSGISRRLCDAFATRTAAATSSAIRRTDVTPHRSMVFISSFVPA
jgi:hypothetical protein